MISLEIVSFIKLTPFKTIPFFRKIDIQVCVWVIHIAAKPIHYLINVSYLCMLVNMNTHLRRIDLITLAEYIYFDNGNKEIILQTYTYRITLSVFWKHCFVGLQIENINDHLPCFSSVHNSSSTCSTESHFKRSTAEKEGIDVQACFASFWINLLVSV